MKVNEMERRCENCQFFAGTVNFGECRRNPPIVLSGAKTMLGTFPLIGHSDWCGEFKGKGVTPDPAKSKN